MIRSHSSISTTECERSTAKRVMSLSKAAPGDMVRVRVVNTDNGPMSVWTTGAAYRVVATDGYDVNDPTLVDGDALTVTAGGRADLDHRGASWWCPRRAGWQRRTAAG